MVIIQMTGDFDEEFMAVVPDDTAHAERLRSQGVLQHLYMRNDYRLCWAVFHAASTEELQSILESFPLYKKLRYEVHEIAEEREETPQP